MMVWTLRIEFYKRRTPLFPGMHVMRLLRTLERFERLHHAAHALREEKMPSSANVLLKHRGWHLQQQRHIRFNEFGVDGGPSAKAWRLKFDVVKNHATTNLGVQVPEIEIKIIVAAAIACKGIGGILFIFGSSLGAYLLVIHLLVSTPILYDIYNYDIEKSEFVQLFIKFTQSLALLGALLFFIGMKNSIPKRTPKKKSHKSKTN